MKCLLQQIIILGVVAIAASQELLCKSSLNFYIPNVKTNWIGAVEYCNRHGMRLAVVDTSSKQTEIIRLAQVSKAFLSTRTDLWIGANDLSQDSKFIWHATGMELKFTQWMKGEPNNKGKQEHCVHMWYEPANKLNWQWNDENCKNMYNFVCENAPIQ